MRRIPVEDQLTALVTMSPAQLREQWTRVTRKPVPRVSARLLGLAIAFELQTKAHSSSRKSSKHLDRLAGAVADERQSRSDIRLVREWKGTLHVVTIGTDKLIRWNEREWGSLSEVARAITGTRWSGPVFFGLKQRKAA